MSGLIYDPPQATFSETTEDGRSLVLRGENAIDARRMAYEGAAAALADLASSYIATLLDDPDASTALSTLGLSVNGKSLVTAANYAAMRALLGLTTSGTHLLASFTGDGSTGTCTFGSILQTYTDLIVKATLRGTGTGTTLIANITVNALGAGGYDSQRTGALSSAHSGAELLAQANWADVFRVAPSDATAGFVSGGELELLNYTSAAHKLMLFNSRRLQHLTSGAAYAYNGNGVARTTDPITSITLAMSSGNFDAGTRIDLYGRR